MATLLLLGLDDRSAEVLERFSFQAGHVPRREAMRTTFETRPEVDLIFLAGDQSEYLRALTALREFRATPPVVVVSRFGEPSLWIEALDAGAADCIAAPFTMDQISSLIDAITARPKTLTA